MQAQIKDLSLILRKELVQFNAQRRRSRRRRRRRRRTQEDNGDEEEWKEGRRTRPRHLIYQPGPEQDPLVRLSLDNQ